MPNNYQIPAEHPGPDCASFVDLLPLLGLSTFEEQETIRLYTHLATCAYCQAQRAAYDQIDAALRRSFAAPATLLPSAEDMMALTTNQERPPEPYGSTTPAPLISQHKRRTRRSRLPTAGQLATYASALHTQSIASDRLDRNQITHDLFERGVQRELVGKALQGEHSMKLRNKAAMSGIDTGTERQVPVTNTSARRHRISTSLHRLLAMAAAVLVVGLLATTFAVFSHRSLSSTGAAATSTQAPTVPPQHPPKSWSPVARLTSPNQFLNAAPAIAPSDPRIVYEVTTGPKLTLRRTADGGATWESFPLPVQNALFYMQLYVSPLNPNVVVLHTDDSTSTSANACNAVLAMAWTSPPANKSTTSPLASLSSASPTGPFDICAQFLSTNGGRSWAQTSDFFDSARIVSSGGGVSGIFMVQGNRLYTYDRFTCQTYQGVCSLGLLVSVDGGMSWRPAPTPSPQTFCGVGMAPTGMVMFAITTSQCGVQGTSDQTIWRSDDAGAHWAPMSHLQFSVMKNLLVVPNSGAAYPTAYLMTSNTNPNDVQIPGVARTTSFQMSQDGGKTWTDVPTNGIPAGWSVTDVIAQTGDGSVIALVGPTDSGGVDLSSWQPDGSSWQLSAPMPPQVASMYVVTASPTAQGGDTLWAVSVSPAAQATQADAPYTNTVYRLQL